MWVTTLSYLDSVKSVNDKAMQTYVWGLQYMVESLMVGSLSPDVDMFGAYGWEP